METLSKEILQQFLSETDSLWETEPRCEVLRKRFKYQKKKDWYRLFLIYWKEKYDLGLKTDLDVEDCDNAIAYLRILCYNLLNKL